MDKSTIEIERQALQGSIVHYNDAMLALAFYAVSLLGTKNRECRRTTHKDIDLGVLVTDMRSIDNILVKITISVLTS